MTVLVAVLQSSPLAVESIVAGIRAPECGAVVVFEGRARSPNEGRRVLRLEYEAYESKARAQLHAIAAETAARHGVRAVAVAHRVGAVAIGEPAMVAATASEHLAEAIRALEELITRVKSECAIWKKEVFADAAAWSGLPSGAAPTRVHA